MFYGAAEFSRDTDLVILASPENLNRLRTALTGLEAECIAVPPFEADYLRRGHAVHFRCRHPDVSGSRIDVMSVMRGVAPFEELWERRTTIETADGDLVDLLALPDLVRAKKTQRDRDWPMVRRLVEVDYLSHREHPSAEHVGFWLAELRTAPLLLELAAGRADAARAASATRPLVARAMAGDEGAVEAGLTEEERAERNADRLYWQPLRAELEALRRRRLEK